MKNSIPLLALVLLVSVNTFAQKTSFSKEDKELATLYGKIFPFYYSNYDSLEHYSEMFSGKLTTFIKKNPATLTYEFQSLKDSNACGIITSPDGNMRVYSWDTQLGGTMHHYYNIYQVRSGRKIFTKEFNEDEADFGTDFKSLQLLKASKQTFYYIGISGGSLSSGTAYESVSVYAIAGDNLDNKVKLIKTQSGMNNSISFEYDLSTLSGSLDTAVSLIKYDTDKKIISIPIVLESGKVTNRFILYQFNGKYFEKIQVQKK